MKYYENLIELGCFSRDDIIRLTGNLNTANSLIQSYLAKGYIERIKHNLYAAISLESRQPVLSRYQIGCRIFKDSYLSNHSAFEVHGYANQFFRCIYVSTESRFADFVYNGVEYRRVSPQAPAHTVKIAGVTVSTLEQTVVDSIDNTDKIAGLEEICRCIELIPELHEKELTDILSERGNGFLCQKVGFILSCYQKDLGLSNEFLTFCRERTAGSRRPLTREYLGSKIYNSEWNLYVPEDFDILTEKG